MSYIPDLHSTRPTVPPTGSSPTALDTEASKLKKSSSFSISNLWSMLVGALGKFKNWVVGVARDDTPKAKDLSQSALGNDVHTSMSSRSLMEGHSSKEIPVVEGDPKIGYESPLFSSNIKREESKPSANDNFEIEEPKREIDTQYKQEFLEVYPTLMNKWMENIQQGAKNYGFHEMHDLSLLHLLPKNNPSPGSVSGRVNILIGRIKNNFLKLGSNLSDGLRRSGGFLTNLEKAVDNMEKVMNKHKDGPDKPYSLNYNDLYLVLSAMVLLQESKSGGNFEGKLDSQAKGQIESVLTELAQIEESIPNLPVFFRAILKNS